LKISEPTWLAGMQPSAATAASTLAPERSSAIIRNSATSQAGDGSSASPSA